ncbi:hypothetical protein KCP69_08060 [Salmonella enterica subsp. enterica]|nr:hypothetical protein KCP69_08060 [Salmonella enterica subsp. enterica]
MKVFPAPAGINRDALGRLFTGSAFPAPAGINWVNTDPAAAGSVFPAPAGIKPTARMDVCWDVFPAP